MPVYFISYNIIDNKSYSFKLYSHIFKQNSDFMYLTGFNEPNSVLVISKTDADSSSTYKTALFVKVSNFL